MFSHKEIETKKLYSDLHKQGVTLLLIIEVFRESYVPHECAYRFCIQVLHLKGRPWHAWYPDPRNVVS